jgi:hypothetical protein
MKRSFLRPFLFWLGLCSVALTTGAQQQPGRYVYDGKNLQVMEDRPVQEYFRWQIWLYPAGVHIPHPTAPGLSYSRWGLIEAGSAETASQQLQALESFETAYSNFFGQGEWGRYTFFNPLGPIAISSEAARNEPSEAFHLSELNSRMHRLIATLQPSLENNTNNTGESQSPVKDYFEQVKNGLVQVAKLYSLLGHFQPQLNLIDDGLVRTGTAVTDAENHVHEIATLLPRVKLPTSTTWMDHTEWAGSDGTIQVAVTEAGSGVSVQQTWTGGDGRMNGAVALTLIPYRDIGDVELENPTRSRDQVWTVRVRSGDTSFSETLACPERKTAKGVLPAVHDRTMQQFLYLVFNDPAQAQDAYAYFLYHQEVGR